MSLKGLALWMAIVGVAAAIVGFALDFSGFLDNFLAEVSGIPLGASAAILIVDRITEDNRKRQWELVKLKTEGAIRSRLMAVVNRTYLEVGAYIDGNNGPLSKVLYSRAESVRDIEIVGRMAKVIGESAQMLGSRESPESLVNPALKEFAGGGGVEDYPPGGKVQVSDEETSDRRYVRVLNELSSRTLLDDVESSLDYVHSVLLPRVLHLGREPKLVELLLDLEAAHNEWRENVELIDDWGAPEEFAWRAVSTLLSQTFHVLSYMSVEMPSVDVDDVQMGPGAGNVAARES